MYARDIENKVCQDPKIKRATNQILSDCVKRESTGVEETDSGETGHLSIDFSRLWSNISEVFRIFFADLETADHDGMRFQ